MVLGVHMLCVAEADFLKKKIFATKMVFLKFIGKFSYYSFLNLIYNEILYYFLYSCTNPIFRKNLVAKIWAKMLSGQPDYRILKSTMTLGQYDEKA